jgi:hypothetical protein
MFDVMALDRFTPSTTDKNILEEMYKDTPIQANVLSLEDFLKLPVNEYYKRNSLITSYERFNKNNKDLKSNNNITNDIYTANGKVC